jgi:carbonic anhydrase/acetyltransferase-like protein (isoleucine patch superfamily)
MSRDLEATKTAAGLATVQEASSGLLVLPYASVSPQFATSPAWSGRGAAVLGRATIRRNLKLGARAVIRADGHFVRLGDDVSLGERATVHIAHDLYPAIIGDRVTLGDNTIVHACTLGDDIVVGDNTVVLDGTVVESGVVIEADSIVFPRSRLDAGKLYSGMPARPVRDLRPGEIEERAAALRNRVGGILSQADSSARRDFDPSVFVAATATLKGRIQAAADSSIWFGCDFDAADGEIAIGPRTNIQDNTRIRCRGGEGFAIGPDSTIGHNVTLGSCRIGARSLVGIGAVVAHGTVVGDDVFLAAGARTSEGQVLEGGWLYGRRPAEKMAPLDAAKRTLIALTVEHYCNYARAFAEAQRPVA